MPLGKPGKVDLENGVISNVKILGFESANKRDYAPQAVKEAQRLYEGVNVNINHIGKGQQRDLGSRFGKYKNVRFIEGDGLRGDLHFNPHHPMAKQLAWYAENMADAFGNSHHAEGRGVMKGGRMLVENITKVQSVDLVADPATTKSLFESVAGETDLDRKENTVSEDLKEVTVEMLEAKRPDLLAKIRTPGRDTDSTALREARALAKKVKMMEAQAVVREHSIMVREELRRANLPKKALTELFVEQLLNAEDKAAVVSMIRDRAAACREDHKPRSTGKSLLESMGNPTGAGSGGGGELKETILRAFGKPVK